jgi:hypothetical protein
MRFLKLLPIINLQSNFFIRANQATALIVYPKRSRRAIPACWQAGLFKTSWRGDCDEVICQILASNKVHAYLSFKKDAATIAFAGYPKAIDSALWFL